MGRFLPIQVLLTIVLIAVSINLAALFFLLQQQGLSRVAYAALNEQRLGVSEVIFAIEDRADQLQRLARLAAASGELSYAAQHRSLRESIAQFRDLIANPAPAHAALPDLADPDLRDWLQSLARAKLNSAELVQLHQVLSQIHQWSEAQAQSIAILVPGNADEVVLMNLASPTQELANWRNSALIEELEYQVMRRIRDEGMGHQRRAEELRRDQLILLAIFFVIMVSGLAAFQRLAVAPLKKVLEAATRIGGGDYRTQIQPDGVQEIRDLATTLNWMADAFAGDIAARLMAEERAQEMEARVREVGDLSPGAIWSIEHTPATGTRAMYTSRGFDELFALGGEAIAKDFEKLFTCIHPSQRKETRDKVASTLREGGVFDIDFLTLRPDGEYRWTRSLARLSRHGNDELRWNGFSMDIHELKLLRQSNEEALRRARSANDAKSAFLANMSHEVRTPLNAIIGIAVLALSENHPRPLRDKFQRIASAGQNLLRLLNDVLDTSKLEAGQMQLRQDDFSLRAVLMELRDLHRDNAKAKGLQFDVVIAPDTPLSLHGDSLRLQQSLGNLLSNALKFTEQGSIELRATLGNHPQQKPDGRLWMEFTVRDTGIGIPNDKIPELFEAFTQQDSGINRAHGGTGLGLHIVQQLAELMDGSVSVDSEVGQGSCFRLLLPFAPAKALVHEDSIQSEAPLELEDHGSDTPSDAQLSPAQANELQNLIDAGDTAVRERIQAWFGEHPPAALAAIQKDLDAFDFEQAADRLRKMQEDTA